MGQDNSKNSLSKKSTSTAKNTFSGFNGYIKGVSSFHVLQGYKYAIKYSATGTGSSVVRVLDNTLKGKKWVVRFDKPHGVKVPFEHININPKISGLGKDPHLWMPPGSTQVAFGTSKAVKVINQINKVALPIAIAVECAVIGKSVYDDVQNKTSRNSVEAVSQCAAGWTGGFGGGFAGASIGTAILPGVGTIIGGIVGSLGGGIGGALGVGAAVEKIGDVCDYGIEERNCENCGKQFKIRKYQGENRKFCEECSAWVIELECNTCSETFKVQKFESKGVLGSEFWHGLCPSVEGKVTPLYMVIDTQCKRCYCYFKARRYEDDLIASEFCHSCSHDTDYKTFGVDADVLELLQLSCQFCAETIFLQISKEDGNSEFHHKYCNK